MTYHSVPDGLLDILAPAGTPTRVQELLQQWEAIDGLDAIAVVVPVAAEKDEIEATIDTLAP